MGTMKHSFDLHFTARHVIMVYELRPNGWTVVISSCWVRVTQHKGLYRTWYYMYLLCSIFSTIYNVFSSVRSVVLQARKVIIFFKLPRTKGANHTQISADRGESQKKLEGRQYGIVRVVLAWQCILHGAPKFRRGLLVNTARKPPFKSESTLCPALKYEVKTNTRFVSL